MPRAIIGIISVIFITMGILGFYQDPVFALIEVDTRHNVTHFLTGLIGLISVAKGACAAIWFGRIFGLIYALLAIAGFATTGPVLLRYMEVNDAGDWLHLIMAIFLFLVGFGNWRQRQ